MSSGVNCCSPKKEEVKEACCEAPEEEIKSDRYGSPLPPQKNEDKKGSCCAPDVEEINKSCSIVEEGTSSTSKIIERVDWQWSRNDLWGAFKCRVSGFRNSYSIKPGIYAIGQPGDDSHVMVSANYKLSFDHLRRALKGINAWIVVLDTKGINVWCAAGKGTFGTEELINRLNALDIKSLVKHRRLIVPQLGAVGVAAHEVKKHTGFKVSYGPVFARDIKAYIENGYKADKDMRRVTFGWIDRLVLTPMEIRPAMKHFFIYAVLILLLFGLGPQGIIFSEALSSGLPFVFAGFISLMTGALITPLLLPYIPFKSFALKGWLSGLTAITIYIKLIGDVALPLLLFSLIFFPFVSSYLALQFTGSTTYTNMSGVNKELKLALPFYKWGGIFSLLLIVTYKLNQWGIL